LIQALGVLAYCKSFVGVWRAHDQIPTFQVEGIESSLRAQIHEQEARRQNNNEQASRTTNARVLAVAMFAPIVALVGVLLQPRIGADPETLARYPSLNTASDYIARNWGEILGLALLFFTLIFAISRVVPALREQRYGRDLLRIAILSPGRTALTAIVLGLVSLALGVYFGQEAATGLRDALIELFRMVSRT
jgi:hypothetical protein